MISALEEKEVRGDVRVAISGLEYDSRNIKRDNLFVALSGFALDGHRFAPEAVARGASSLVVERWLNTLPRPQVRVPNSRAALARLAHQFYGHPGEKLTVIGVTGTNGKTTTAYLVKKILETAGEKVGLIGTIQYEIAGEALPAWNTTPESLDLARFFVRLQEAGAKSCVMEVSSHALALHRVEAIDFRVAVFTNLTQDHLDYHRTMENYREAKAKLFRSLQGKDRWAAINRDDPESAYFEQQSGGSVFTYSLEGRGADLIATRIQPSENGSRFELKTDAGTYAVNFPLVGRFNVANALAAAAGAHLVGIGWETVAVGLEKIEPVPGRVEPVQSGQPFTVVIDYAHTPDGLKQILTLARSQSKAGVIVVFGCGGDRDRTKRPLMGEIAGALADRVIVTSDNPRDEDPQKIIDEVLPGLRGKKNVRTSVDRAEAIADALHAARRGDWVVIAGKGHEEYQIIGKEKIPFSDREEVKRVLGTMGFRG